jgi:hypothetical protein
MHTEVDWEKWAAIGQIAGALGTFLAVLTSLYLARDSIRPKLSVSAGIRIVIEAGAQEPFPKIIVFDVRNLGMRDVYVDQIGWRVGRWPFRRPDWLARGFAVQTFGTVLESTNPPFALAQGRRVTSMLQFEQTIRNINNRDGDRPFFAKVWPIIGIRRSPVFAQVHLSSGETIKARVEKDLERALFEAEAEKLRVT